MAFRTIHEMNAQMVHDILISIRHRDVVNFAIWGIGTEVVVQPPAITGLMGTYGAFGI
ncbi:hypothetical protein ACFPOG_04855 [Paenibacillus aestuarii]|uniref:Uncharacterized protein n=1 Tax=Paenibacillus aestuarii TaxID=516965 RepID=A0ABW0K3E2_9BACL